MNRATCTFEGGGLRITTQAGGSYRCPGPTQDLTDLAVFVDVTLVDPGSCAGVWFRFDAAGYALRVCGGGYELVTHGAGGAGRVAVLRTIKFESPLPLGAPTRVGLSAVGPTFRFYRDGREAGTWSHTAFTSGRVVLGVFQTASPGGPPYVVSFANVKIWATSA